MGRETFVTDSTDPDRLVSWNLKKARVLRGWTQAEATQRLAQFGLRWSVASLSDAERSWTPDGRLREFTATDLVAFSLAYGLPLTWWLLPPPPDERGGMTVDLEGIDQDNATATLTDLCFRSSPEVENRLSSLGIARTLVAEDKRHLLALLDEQESKLVDWAEDVKATRAQVEQQPESPTLDTGELR